MGHSQSHSRDPHSGSNGKSKSPEHENQNQEDSQLPPSTTTPAEKRPIDTLNDRQKFLIRQTWDIAKQDLERIGFTTFADIFEKQPQLRVIFLESWKITSDDLALDDRLTSHGNRVTNIISQVVDNLDNLDGVNTMLLHLGRRHITYKVSAEMIPVIGMSFIQSFQPLLEAEDLWTSEIEKCWNIIINHVCDSIVIQLKSNGGPVSNPEDGQSI